MPFSPSKIQYLLGFSLNELSILSSPNSLSPLCLTDVGWPSTPDGIERAREAQQPLEFQVVLGRIRVRRSWHEHRSALCLTDAGWLQTFDDPEYLSEAQQQLEFQVVLGRIRIQVSLHNTSFCPLGETFR